MAGKFRIEHDSMGELKVPADAWYGAQTHRAVQNFQISGRAMPAGFIQAVVLIKAAVAEANRSLGLLDKPRADAIARAAEMLLKEIDLKQFPLDVYQTGSGTSSNMNVNEVMAYLANRDGKAKVHPNDHVNLGQSSNDVIPSAIQVSAMLAWRNELLPALKHLQKTIVRRAKEFDKIIKTGRTHLMDAMPLSVGQEFGAYAAQLQSCIDRLNDSSKRMSSLPLGGTAVGTGINADPRMLKLACAALSKRSGVKFSAASNKFEKMAAQDHAVEWSGQLNVVAVCLMKIANDLRWMNSGPLAGLGEIELPALQPGSSIMPGKVNPVIPEAVAMVCARVMGLNHSVSIAGQSGNFQLNVMLPLIADCILESTQLLSNACMHLADKAISGIKLRPDKINAVLDRNPILVTALNPIIGYEAAAKIAKRAYAENRAVLDVAKEMTSISESKLKELLDPKQLIKARKGSVGSGGG
jgi:fumarate hydratase, class II